MADWLTRIKAKIKADGRSYRSISKAAGLGDNFVSEMILEGKEKEPGVLKLLALCAELGTSATYILTGVELGPDDEEMLGLLAGMAEPEKTTFLNLARQLRAARQ